ncbi:hypothetical protein A2814_01005 [Candidatus Nomurabacteria bacterium RIFCSPHIGHO2_01_FULL_38_19]|uniref:GIY-YIG domain-containing protein n=1 Tax=Candidatus Nomurabacteria bacterium RIFCSPHIGHO2_01_FULL_38_19 TaxID=1801732 RepID=A0A1F6UR98_9BACT|nr:MAG: hypothetical protein A2814_01005 [Candidatus Nomurabacteria bacterium RIFCSPHIGHO2_01_FULL_38_19]
MPFTQQTPRMFSRQDIESLNENQLGIYSIFKQGQWIYIGKGDIRTRLLAHLNGDKPCIIKLGPTHWVGELLNDPQMSNREKQLILEFKPPCNDKIG